MNDVATDASQDILICHLYDSPLLYNQSLPHRPESRFYVFKRPNHSMYIAYLSNDGDNIYIGEHIEEVIYKCLNAAPLDKFPIHSNLLNFYSFNIRGQSELYIACRHSDSKDLFMFKKLDDNFLIYDTTDVDPYHIQDFMDSNINLIEI